jgi:putative aldouronate transport system permease protein
MLNELKSERYKRVVQSISYLPHFISTVVVVGMLVTLLAGDGVVNNALEKWSLGPFQFLLQPQYFRTIYIASNIWQSIGWGSIIYLAALSNVNPQLYEAAIMDGAGRFKQLIHITLPSIAPTISIMFILQMGKIMSTSFQKILLLMNGTNMVVSDVISTYVYRRGILGAEFSYSTAVGMFESVIAVIFVVSTNAISRKVGDTSLW